MARTDSKRAVGPTPPHHGLEPETTAPDDLTQLRNRIAVLTLGAALGFMIGMITLSAAFAGDTPVLARAAASVPLLAALAAVLRVRQLRAELRRRRGAREAPSPELVSSDRALE